MVSNPEIAPSQPVSTQPVLASANPEGLSFGLKPHYIELVNLHSRGHSVEVISNILGVPYSTITSRNKFVVEKVGGRTMAGTIYKLCKEGLIKLGPDEQATAVERSAALTPRQREVLKYLMSGLRRNEIAAHLTLAPVTINSHLKDIYRTFGVNSAEETARAGFAAGIRILEDLTPATEKPAANENRRMFLSWSYPSLLPTEFEDLSANDINAMANLVSTTIKNLRQSINGISQTQLDRLISITDRWLQGQTAGVIAEAEKKKEGSILLILSTFARRMGEILPQFTDLVDETRGKTGDIGVEANVTADNNGRQAEEPSAVENPTLRRWIRKDTYIKLALAVGKELAGTGAYDSKSTEAIALIAEAQRSRETPTVEELLGQLAVEARPRDEVAEIDEMSLQEIVTGILDGSISEKSAGAVIEPYRRPVTIPENFDAEVITFLNSRRGNVHIGEILMAVFGRRLSDQEYWDVKKALDNICRNGFAVNQGKGYYATYIQEIEETPKVAVTALPVNEDVPDLDLDDDVSVTFYNGAGEKKDLNAMLKAAGIYDKKGHKPRHRGRGKRRR